MPPARIAIPLIALAGTLCAAAPPAHAQPAPRRGRTAAPSSPAASPSSAVGSALAAPALSQASAREQARAHFERGVALADDGRWQDAIRELTAARALAPTPPVLYNLGVAYRAVGRNRAAIASLQEFARATSGALAPERARELARMVAELRAGLARLVLTVEPAAAAVLVDGAPLASDAAARGYEVDPGRHVIIAQAEGHRAATRTVTLPPGGLAQLELRLPATDDAGRVLVESSVPAAMIRIDGHDISNSTADEYLTPGAHTIDVVARGHAAFHRDVAVRPGATVRVRAVLHDERSVLTSPWLWTGVALGVGALVVGGVLLFSGPSAPFVGPYGHVTDALVEARR